MKRAQIVGQIFVYTFASFIFMLVLIYGYKAINQFIDNQRQVEMIEFKTELESSIYGIAPTLNTERKAIKVPGDVQKICFVDLRLDPIGTTYPSDTRPEMPSIPGLCQAGPPAHKDFNARMCNSWDEDIQKNVLFYPSMNLHVNVGDITPQDSSGNEAGYLCVEVSNGLVYLDFKGNGDSAIIRKGSPTR